MKKRRTELWLAVVVLVIGAIPVAILGLWGYMSATAPTLHPNPQDSPSVTLAPPEPSLADAVAQAQQIARAALGDQNLPGLSVAVAAGGNIVWAEGFGWANLERREPVTPDTQFRVGTASTALTSAAVGLLLEKGRLKLEDEIQVYVPAFPRKQWPVTLHQVMGHVAGIGNDSGDEGPLFSVNCARPREALPHFANQPLLFEPGTEYRYSSYGWILVSAAVEAAADEPFFIFLRRQLFEPLGMQHTTPDVATGPIAGMATPYFPRFASDPRYGLHLMRDLDYSCYAGSSAFLSTASDLVRFGLAITGGRLLQPSTVQQLQTSQRLQPGRETGYGLGWDVKTVALRGQPARMVGRDGDVLGGKAVSLMTFPDHGIVVAVLSNISYADTSGVALNIADAFAKPQGPAGR